MLIEWLWELKESIDRHGIRWGVALTLFALFRKERRNYFLDKRDDAIFHNQKLIMDSLGIGDQYRGQVTLSETDRQNYRKLYLSSRKAIQSVRLLKMRRTKRMVQQSINFSVLFLAIAGAIKLILQQFGIDLVDVTDENVNAIANGLAALLTIIGVIRNNFTKKIAPQPDPQSLPQHVEPDKFIQG